MSGLEFGMEGEMEEHLCDCEHCTEGGQAEFRPGSWFAKCCAGWSAEDNKVRVVQALVEHLRDAHEITPTTLVASVAREHNKCLGAGCKDCDDGVAYAEETITVAESLPSGLRAKAGASA